MLTLAQAAARLGLSPSTLRGQVGKGRLKADLMGKTYVVSEREVERYRREHLGKRRSWADRPAWLTVDVPVIDGTATLPDGRTAQSGSKVVRVPLLVYERPK